MGRAAGKMETIEAAVAKLTEMASEISAQLGSSKQAPNAAGLAAVKREGKNSLLGDVQLAKELESHRLKFSGSPSFDPSWLLEPLTREIYEHPIQCSLDPSECPLDPPRVQV